MTMLTDTHLMLLSAASQRADGRLIPPERLRGGALAKLGAKLLALGFVEEVGTGHEETRWRTREDGEPIGLRITDACLAALGIEPETNPPTEAGAETSSSAPPKPSQDSEARPSSGLRAGSKQARVVALLQRDEGATLDALTAETGWLPHTARAALTGLRQKGYEIHKSKDQDGRTVYCVPSGPAQPQPEEAP